jgi:hypothetical protein
MNDEPQRFSTPPEEACRHYESIDSKIAIWHLEH